MKRRRRPTAEQLAWVDRAAQERRLELGLPAVPPENEEYERLQAERKRKRPKGKR